LAIIQMQTRHLFVYLPKPSPNPQGEVTSCQHHPAQHHSFPFPSPSPHTVVSKSQGLPYQDMQTKAGNEAHRVSMVVGVCAVFRRGTRAPMNRPQLWAVSTKSTTDAAVAKNWLAVYSKPPKK
jgi:hypothetical protein